MPTDQRSLSVGQCTNSGSGCAATVGGFVSAVASDALGWRHLELLHLVEGDACERKAAVLLDDRQLRVRAHRCDHRADRKLRDLRLRLQVSAAIRIDRFIAAERAGRSEKERTAVAEAVSCRYIGGAYTTYRRMPIGGDRP